MVTGLPVEARSKRVTHLYCSAAKLCEYLKNEQRSRDAAAQKRANTSGVGKINNY